jgi:hypothetical protein
VVAVSGLPGSTKLGPISISKHKRSNFNRRVSVSRSRKANDHAIHAATAARRTPATTATSTVHCAGGTGSSGRRWLQASHSDCSNPRPHNSPPRTRYLIRWASPMLNSSRQNVTGTLTKRQAAQRFGSESSPVITINYATCKTLAAAGSSSLAKLRHSARTPRWPDGSEVPPLKSADVTSRSSPTRSTIT